LFDQFCDETGPAGLMAGAKSGAIVTVKVFVEEDEILPVRIAPKELYSTGGRALTILIAQEDVNEPAEISPALATDRIPPANGSGTPP